VSRSSSILWLCLAFLVYALGVLAYRDSLMDDTFIHLQYARNLRAAGTLAFNPGEPSLGATSPLWILLLALFGASELAARLLSVACGGFAVWLFALHARRCLGGGNFAAAASIAWAGNLWLVRHAPNGMESTCALLVVLGAFELRARPRGGWRDVGLGLVLAAAWLVRPEFVLLIGLFFCMDLASSERMQRLRTWLPLCVAVCALWVGFAWWRVGHVLPDTVSAKSAGPSLGKGVAVLGRCAELVSLAHPIEAVGLVLALFWGLRRGLRLAWRRHPLAPPVGFALLLVATYACLDVQVQPRYLLPALPCLTLAGFVAWRALCGASLPAAVTVCVAALAASACVSAVRVLPATRDYSRALRPALVPLVQEVRSRATGTAVVATPDIGVVGYYGQVRVLDLGGLIEPRAQALQDSMGYDAMLVSGAFLDLGACDFVIDRAHEPARFAGQVSRNRHWRPLRTTTIPNLGLSRPGPYFYTLYALEAPSPSSR